MHERFFQHTVDRNERPAASGPIDGIGLREARMAAFVIAKFHFAIVSPFTRKVVRRPGVDLSEF